VRKKKNEKDFSLDRCETKFLERTVNRLMESENKKIKLVDEQAFQEFLSVMFSCLQLENSRKDSKICVTYRNAKNFSWFKAGDELEVALKSLYESKEKDCWISIAEFSEERRDQNYVASIKAFYLRLPKTRKFNPTTKDDGLNMILDYCEAYKLPTPSVIIYDGNEYCLMWILKEPLGGGYSSVELWKKIQSFLAERFFYFLDEGLYIYDEKIYRKTAFGQMRIKIFVVANVVAKKKVPLNDIITIKKTK